MDLLYAISIVILFGMLIGYFITYIKIPNVTGYLIAGIIIGPYALNLISIDQLNKLDIFSTIALSYISFTIGAEFNFKFIKKMSYKPFVVAFISALTTLILVTIFLTLFGCDYVLAILLGAIASSTAPAIIMMLIKDYKAKGQFTNTLLSVVAIDDVISIILFGFCLAISKSIINSKLTISSFLFPFFEIIISIALGLIFGYIFGIIIKKIKNDNNIISISIIYLLGIIFIMNKINISPLLTFMISGCAFINLYKKRITEKTLHLMDLLISPFLIIFFVISGASLNLKLLPSVGLFGIIYIVVRSFGKIIGAKIGSIIVKEPKKIIKYLGPSLLSQTGLAIGLATIAISEISYLKEEIMTIVLGASLVFDLISPILTKQMFIKTKEIKIE